jgi:transposase
LGARSRGSRLQAPAHRIDNRATLNGILFVLRSGIPWRMLPREMGCGSGVTCWRRLREWQRRGVWRRLHQLMLERLAAAHSAMVCWNYVLRL